MSALRKLGPRLAIAALLVAVALTMRIALRSTSRTPVASPSASGSPTPPQEPRDIAPPAEIERSESPARTAAAADSVQVPSDGRWLRVHVVDENGRGVPDRLVNLNFRSDADAQLGAGDQATTDANGECSLDATKVRGELGPWLSIHVDPPDGYVRRFWRAPASTRRIELTLVRAGRLSGLVSYGDGSIPNGEAWLMVQWRLDDGTTGQESADVVEGAYDFGVTVAGQIEHVELESMGNAHAHLEVPAFTVGPGEQVRRDFVFDLGSTLDIAFRDAATHEPIAGVRALGLQRDEEVSNESGHLVLANVLCAHCRVRLRFKHPDYAPLERQIVGPESAQTLALDIELEHGLELGGVVTDVRGTPQIGLRVACEQSARSRSGQGSSMTVFHADATTDEDGRFAMRGIPPLGAFEMSFVSRDVRVLGFELVTMPEAARRERWIVPDPVSILVTVVDAHDEPVPGLQVLATAAQTDSRRVATTDASGRARIDDALPGDWTLSATHGARGVLRDYTLPVRQRSSAVVEVGPLGASSVELHLAAARDSWPARTAHLRFVDARSLDPLASLDWLQLSGVDNTLSRGWGGVAAKDGALAVELLVGSYEVNAQALDYTTRSQLIEVEPGDGWQELWIALEPTH